MSYRLKKRLLGVGVLLLLLVIIAPSLFEHIDNDSLHKEQQSSIDAKTESTALDEFVDAFMKGITPPKEISLDTTNKKATELHASEIIDAYTVITDSPIQKGPVKYSSPNLDTTGHLIELQSIAINTPLIAESLQKGAEKSLILTIEDSTRNNIISDSQPTSSSTMPTMKLEKKAVSMGDDDSHLEPLPMSQRTPEYSMEETTSNPTLTSMTTNLSNQIAQNLTEINLSEKNNNANLVLIKELKTLPSATEIQIAKEALQITLPTKSMPDAPDFVSALDKPLDMHQFQNKEKNTVDIMPSKPNTETLREFNVWALQLATFSNKYNAEKLQNTLRSKGYSAYIKEDIRSNDRHSLFKVFIGPKMRTEELDSLKTRLQKEMGLSGMVVRFQS